MRVEEETKENRRRGGGCEGEDRGCIAVMAYCYSPAKADGTIMNLKNQRVRGKEKVELAPRRMTVHPVCRTCSPNSVPDGGRLDPVSFFGPTNTRIDTDVYRRGPPATTRRGHGRSHDVGPLVPPPP